MKIGKTFILVCAAMLIAAALIAAFGWKHTRNAPITKAPVSANQPDNALVTDVGRSPLDPPDDSSRASQSNVSGDEKQASDKREWLKSIGMPDEGVNRVDVELRAIVGTLMQYHEAYGEYPQGGNKEIAAALRGRDGKMRRAFLNWQDSKMSSDGELLDPWKKPYSIQITKEVIAIYSVGPDGIAGSGDDIKGN